MEQALIELGVKHNCCRTTIVKTVDVNTLELHVRSLDAFLPLDFPENIHEYTRKPLASNALGDGLPFISTKYRPPSAPGIK